MPLQQTGRVCRIGQTVTFQSEKGNTYYRRELVLDITRCDMYTGERSQYETFAAFEFDGDNCKMLDTLKEEQVVTVDFVINGRKYTDKRTGEVKYFNSLRGMKVTPRQTAQQPVAPTPQQPVATTQQEYASDVPQQYANADLWKRPAPQPAPQNESEQTDLPF